MELLAEPLDFFVDGDRGGVEARVVQHGGRQSSQQVLIRGGYLEGGVRHVRDVYLCVQVLAAATDTRIVCGACSSVIETALPLIERLLLILWRIPLISVQHRCLRPRLLLQSLVDLATVQT